MTIFYHHNNAVWKENLQNQQNLSSDLSQINKFKTNFIQSVLHSVEQLKKTGYKSLDKIDYPSCEFHR